MAEILVTVPMPIFITKYLMRYKYEYIMQSGNSIQSEMIEEMESVTTYSLGKGWPIKIQQIKKVFIMASFGL